MRLMGPWGSHRLCHPIIRCAPVRNSRRDPYTIQLKWTTDLVSDAFNRPGGMRRGLAATCVTKGGQPQPACWSGGAQAGSSRRPVISAAGEREPLPPFINR